MSELPYNRSLLVTSKGHIKNTNNYKCPSEYKFRGISVKQVILNNPPNVDNHQIELQYITPNPTPGEPDITHPPEYIDITRGSYSPEMYTAEVKSQLDAWFNSKGVDFVELNDDDVSAQTGLPVGKVGVSFVYREGTNTFRFGITNKTNNYYLMKFSDDMNRFLGLIQPDSVYYAIPTSTTAKQIKSDMTAVLYPRYYVVRSSALQGYGYTENESESNIIAIVPHKQDASTVTVWENHESHMHTLFFDEGELHHSLDLYFYVEESEIPIHEPNFLITFVTSS